MCVSICLSVCFKGCNNNRCLPFSESLQTPHPAESQTDIVGIELLFGFIRSQSLIPLVQFLVPVLLNFLQYSIIYLYIYFFTNYYHGKVISICINFLLNN